MKVKKFIQKKDLVKYFAIIGVVVLGIGTLLVPSFIIPPSPDSTESESPHPTAVNENKNDIPPKEETKLYSQEMYEQWKSAYLRVEGEKARVVTHENGETVSEGIAYGMLLAAYHNDFGIFDKYVKYIEGKTNEEGLMHWKIAPDGTIREQGIATDAETDRANALLIAYEKTNNESYMRNAISLINEIERTLIDPELKYLKPWVGATPEVINLSYYDPYVFDKFYTVTNNPLWLDLIDNYYKIAEDIKNNHGAAKTGFMPDWSTAEGNPSTNNRSFNTSYDASRVYWRLMVAAMHGDERAKEHMKLVREYGNSIDIKGTHDFWAVRALDGTPNYKEQNIVGALPFAAAYLLSGSPEDQEWAINALNNTWDKNYFNFTLKTLLISSFEKELK